LLGGWPDGLEKELLPLGPGAVAFQARLNDRFQKDGLKCKGFPARFDAGQAEQVDDESVQSFRLLGDAGEERATMLRILHGPFQQSFDASFDDREGRLQLMGNIGNKIAAQALESAELARIVED
jgi:hypothetical protein